MLNIQCEQCGRSYDGSYFWQPIGQSRWFCSCKEAPDPLVGSERGLVQQHRAELHASGLNDETIEASGIHSSSSPSRIAQILRQSLKVTEKFGTSMVIPFYGLDGSNGFSRIKPGIPRAFSKAKPNKYESPKGESNRAYFPPSMRELLNSGTYSTLFIVEGEKKALSLTQSGFPCIGLVGVEGWHTKGKLDFIEDLQQIVWQDRTVYIVFDSDIVVNPNVQKAEEKLAKAIKKCGASVRLVRIPHTTNAKMGADDFLVAKGAEAFKGIADSAKPYEKKPKASEIEFATEAQAIIDTVSVDELPTLRFWSGSWWQWSEGRYELKPPSEIESTVVSSLDAKFENVGRSQVSNTMMHLRSRALLLSTTQAPSWLDGQNDWKPQDIVATKNALVHLPSYVSCDDFIRPATPAFFTFGSVDYEFEKEPPRCDRWLEFLMDLWCEDPQSIDLLQEWFGYCLTPDTSQQKILFMIGGKRAGKGTISRVLRSVVGNRNVSGPRLSSLAGEFGLWPLLGKTVAIVADARLGNKSDQAAILEVLLSISGEDALDVSRKGMETLTDMKFSTRFTIISNELPRLNDSSGALVGRMLLLKFTKTFFGKEDHGLTEALESERSGILHWAIAGWKRLRDRGYFVQPESGSDMKAIMNDLSSPISAFVNECCELHPANFSTVQLLYSVYEAWCKDAGRDPSNVQVFGRDLSAAFSEIENKQRRFDGVQKRGYCGVRPKIEWVSRVREQ